MSNQADIIAAISQIAEDTDGGLDKKPNVSDVEALTGFDVSAAERDEAWDAFNASDEPEQAEAVVQGPAKAASTGAAVVTNNWTANLSIEGVVIAPEQSAEVPNFDPDKPVIKQWLAAKVISAD